MLSLNLVNNSRWSYFFQYLPELRLDILSMSHLPAICSHHPSFVLSLGNSDPIKTGCPALMCWFVAGFIVSYFLFQAVQQLTIWFSLPWTQRQSSCLDLHESSCYNVSLHTQLGLTNQGVTHLSLHIFVILLLALWISEALLSSVFREDLLCL